MKDDMRDGATLSELSEQLRAKEKAQAAVVESLKQELERQSFVLENCRKAITCYNNLVDSVLHLDRLLARQAEKSHQLVNE